MSDDNDSATDAMKLDHERMLHALARRQAAAEQYAKMAMERDAQFREHSTQYGQMALRSVFLLNGGALVSLIAFMGNIAQADKTTNLHPGDFVTGFSFYVAGLVLALLSMLSAYLNFQHNAQATANLGALANVIIEVKDEWPHDHTDENYQWAYGTFLASVVFGVLSVICFILGSIYVAVVL